jgi:hypothetical protein
MGNKNKLSPKKERELIFKMLALNTLVINTVDELDPNNGLMKDFLQSAKEFQKSCEELEKIVFANNADAIGATNYISELAHKVDTVIRKNYVQ